jgi:tripartite-type tricarboxylate transporter receptor subunit TctC
MVNYARRQFLHLAAGAAVLSPVSWSASAQTAPGRTDNWPNRPITLLHGFAAGGSTDILARIIAEGLTKHLGQPVIVEARPGAGSTAATSQVARVAPDGHTLILLTGSNPIAAALYRSLPYRTVDDFSMIGFVVEYPYVLVTYRDHSIRNLADLLATARSRSGRLLYGTAGTGSGPHLGIEHFCKLANIQLQHVPYRGGAPAATDLIGKQIDLVCDPPTNLLEFIKDGRFRALGVTGARRFFSLPEIPAMAEVGVPGYEVTSFCGLAAPAGLPTVLVARLNGAIAAVVKEFAVIERLHALGVEPRTSSPDEFKGFIVAEIAKWSSVVASANIERL